MSLNALTPLGIAKCSHKDKQSNGTHESIRGPGSRSQTGRNGERNNPPKDMMLPPLTIVRGAGRHS